MWVCPIIHRVKAALTVDYTRTNPEPTTWLQVNPTFCLRLPLCCVSVSGPVIDVFINPVVKAKTE